ncbi:MAG: hypothetical protein KGJ02_04680 [Verrucomicrobiota bacterium]|nr:hypothetical protein [Verrucomicrobiota bacterium]
MPVKTALLRPFTSILLSRPAWADLVKWTVVALPHSQMASKSSIFPGEAVLQLPKEKDFTDQDDSQPDHFLNLFRKKLISMAL